MGSVIGKAMDDNMKKQQQFMLETQQMQLERQVQMQNYMREQMMAMQIARTRDLFVWYTSFFSVTTVGCVAGAVKAKCPRYIAPLIPLGFIFGYQYDMAYGTKMDRMRAEADRVLKEQGSLVDMPQALPTIKLLDQRRQKGK